MRNTIELRLAKHQAQKLIEAVNTGHCGQTVIAHVWTPADHPELRELHIWPDKVDPKLLEAVRGGNYGPYDLRMPPASATGLKILPSAASYAGRPWWEAWLSFFRPSPFTWKGLMSWLIATAPITLLAFVIWPEQTRDLLLIGAIAWLVIKYPLVALGSVAGLLIGVLRGGKAAR